MTKSEINPRDPARYKYRRLHSRSALARRSSYVDGSKTAGFVVVKLFRSTGEFLIRRATARF